MPLKLFSVVFPDVVDALPPGSDLGDVDDVEARELLPIVRDALLWYVLRIHDDVKMRMNRKLAVILDADLPELDPVEATVDAIAVVSLGSEAIEVGHDLLDRLDGEGHASVWKGKKFEIGGDHHGHQIATFAKELLGSPGNAWTAELVGAGDGESVEIEARGTHAGDEAVELIGIYVELAWKMGIPRCY